MEPNDPYLILLRRELTRAEARLRRYERERDTRRDAPQGPGKPEAKQQAGSIFEEFT
jgi:hypothetical protein